MTIDWTKPIRMKIAPAHKCEVLHTDFTDYEGNVRAIVLMTRDNGSNDLYIPLLDEQSMFENIQPEPVTLKRYATVYIGETGERLYLGNTEDVAHNNASALRGQGYAVVASCVPVTITFTPEQ